MFFTQIGKIIAHVIFWLSAFRVGLGFYFAYETPDMASNRAAASRYLAAETTGQAINEGMMYLFLAVALGVLCEISARRNTPAEQPQDQKS